MAGGGVAAEDASRASHGGRYVPVACLYVAERESRTEDAYVGATREVIVPASSTATVRLADQRHRDVFGPDELRQQVLSCPTVVEIRLHAP